jgi:cellulose synthase (UDP-forming)
MRSSQVSSSFLRSPAPPQTRLRLRMATLVMFSIVAIAGLVVAAWFAGEDRISKIFEQIDLLQQQPPLWLEVPMVASEYLLAPTILLGLIAFGITKVSPQPRAWSRTVVITILLTLTVRYVLWRSLSTLNLGDPFNGTFSLGLLGFELLALGSNTLRLGLMLKTRDRRMEADAHEQQVKAGLFQPTVDVMIPTYDEPAFILRRTIIGCQAMDYPHKTLYLLDDTRRPEIQALAAELGCEYITRPDNRHAKAGNINHAIAHTEGDLIVIFDADFVPTTNFLTRTVGFFQDEKVALVQTPQSFYNPDPIANNLGLQNILTPEDEVFYRQIQPMRDGIGSVTCCGSSFVLRRTAIEELNGFDTESIAEDYFTGVRLSARGYQLIYLDEKLSAGLAAENMAAYATQRLRWARGTLQAFFIAANPLTTPGLSFLQRLGHLEGLLHWFTTFSRIWFLLMPLTYAFLGVIPIRATASELIYFFLPYYLTTLTVFAWLNYRTRSAFLADVCSLVLAFPMALTVISVMLRPFSQGFKVTPKGTQSDRFSFNWGLALPLIILFIVTALSLWHNLGMCFIKGAWETTVSTEEAQQIKGIGLGWMWSGYNLVLIGIALLALLDAPQPDPYPWFNLRRTVQVTVSPGTPQAFVRWGTTDSFSEVGMRIVLTEHGMPQLSQGEALPVEITITEIDLTLAGQLVQVDAKQEGLFVQILFEGLSLSQCRQLVKLLFCRPGQWITPPAPSELQSLALFLWVLIRPRFLRDRTMETSPLLIARG